MIDQKAVSHVICPNTGETLIFIVGEPSIQPCGEDCVCALLPIGEVLERIPAEGGGTEVEPEVESEGEGKRRRGKRE